MALTNAGRDFLTQVAIGEAVNPFNNANAHIGVGDGVTAFAAAQTDLVGANKTRKAMEATFPQRTDNTVTFKAIYTDAQANHGWKEWAVFNASTDGVMFNRKVEDNGTKASGTWALTVALTINN